MFNIELDQQPITIEEEATYKGRITIRGFSESFFAPATYWSSSQYYEHWLNSLERLIDGIDMAVFIVTMRDPNQANFVFLWATYRVEKTFKLQNRVLFLDSCQDKSWQDWAECVGPYKSINDDGIEISEWEVSIDDLIAFHSRLKQSI